MNHSHLFPSRRRALTYLTMLLVVALGLVLARPSPASSTSSITVKLAVGNAPLTGWYPDTYWVTTGSPVYAVVTGEEVWVEVQKRNSSGVWVKVSGRNFTAQETVRLPVPIDQNVTRPVKTQMWRIAVRTGNYRNVMQQNFRVIGGPAAPPLVTLLTRAVSLATNRWDRFNPCTPITWAMDVRRSPYGRDTTVRLVKAIIETLRSKTGLNFVFKGYVNHSGDPRVRSAYNLTIVWANTTRAGASSVDHGFMRGSSFLGLTKGTAVVGLAKLTTAKTKVILLHEVMHVLGAGHSSSTADLMYPVAVGQTTFGAGDLAVLKQLDAKNTCF